MSNKEQQGIEQIILNRPESVGQLIDDMSPEVYDSLKLAVEIGKWADGRRLEPLQLDSCLQAVILYEAKHLPEQDRIGFDLSASCESRADDGQVKPITVVDSAQKQGNKA